MVHRHFRTELADLGVYMKGHVVRNTLRQFGPTSDAYPISSSRFRESQIMSRLLGLGETAISNSFLNQIGV